VFWWYKQNMVLFTPKDYVLNSNLKNSNLKDVVHYELFNSKIAQYENNLHHIKSGKASKLFYIQMLFKSFFGEQIIDSIKSIFRGK
jgi:hypothetical protein